MGRIRQVIDVTLIAFAIIDVPIFWNMVTPEALLEQFPRIWTFHHPLKLGSQGNSYKYCRRTTTAPFPLAEQVTRLQQTLTATAIVMLLRYCCRERFNEILF
jgi:hypothetical protein